MPIANPDYAPQLATLVKTPPSGDEWLHEIKFDGYRIGCRIRGGAVTLVTRNGKDWTAAFPEIAAAAAKLKTRDALLDGEVALVLPDGRTSFQRLQNASAGGTGDGAADEPRGTLAYFVFDLLRLDGRRVAPLPLDERKATLAALIGRGTKGRIRYSDHVDGRGDEYFAHACRLGLEGIISKRRDLPYEAGRHGGWVKTKCIQRQEFVIGGFTNPAGARVGLGALLIGHYDDRRLVFAGKVGTGFTHKAALELRRRLDTIVQADSPFTPPPGGPLGRNAHWVAPELVCEVEFTEWTGDGKIRHPSFQGLRADKKAAQVVRERAAETSLVTATAAARTATSAASTSRSFPAPRGASPDAGAGAETVAGVRISHPDRVIYPKPRTTKLELARYYEAVAGWLVPHVAGRPLTLVRCPEGIAGQCFFMKHSKVWARGPLRRVSIQEKTKVGEYLIADDLPAIVGLVQTGILEIHTWNSTDGDLERPNRIVIDLDPGERVAWPRVAAAARVVRTALAAVDLESFAKTTGGRGVHVVVPLAPHADWSTCLSFARALSEAIERSDPATYTTRFAKAGREDKILIDYLRNNRTNTSIAAYSTRARAGGPVSTPITWAELRSTLDPGKFTVATVPARLRQLTGDPWQGYWTCRQKLTAVRLRAVEARP